MDIPKIQSARAIDSHKLLVCFTDGSEKIYDCRPLLDLDRFFLLRNEAFFKQVRVDAGGYGLSWNDDIDLSEYELWTRGVRVEKTKATP